MYVCAYVITRIRGKANACTIFIYGAEYGFSANYFVCDVSAGRTKSVTMMANFRGGENWSPEVGGGWASEGGNVRNSRICNISSGWMLDSVS